uniref:Trefoil factor 2 n=1 Tax=Sciurus vulgaris TaxID=55149 RepID=A0A8D2D155_SCIVU
MGPRGAQLLAVLLVLGLCVLVAGQHPSPCRCSRINPYNRKDCGFPFITKDQCFVKGCCYDHKVGGVPWCFYPLPDQVVEQCVMEASARSDCGYPGITTEKCASRHCCFSNVSSEGPWCYFPEPADDCHH